MTNCIVCLLSYKLIVQLYNENLFGTEQQLTIVNMNVC